jgi:hypothetical protein
VDFDAPTLARLSEEGLGELLHERDLRIHRWAKGPQDPQKVAAWGFL